MDEIGIVLQFIALIFLYFILINGIKFLRMIGKKRRIRDFAIGLDEFSTNDSLIFKIVFKFSDLLESLVIFDNIGRTYDEYVDKDSRLKKGINYISIKILLGLLFIGMYMLVVFLYRQGIDVVVVMLIFILGYIVPDFYCLFISSRIKRLTNNKMIGAIIVMCNSYKVGRSTEQAISDVVERSEGKIREEFIKVLSDLRVGMTAMEAFRRMYERTGNRIVYEISNLLYGISKSGVAASQVFEGLEKKLLRNEKFMGNVRNMRKINLLTFVVFAFLPLIFMGYVMFFKLNLEVIITSLVGGIVIVILFILYLLYSFVIWKIANEVK